jgi:hypothetical protein
MPVNDSRPVRSDPEWRRGMRRVGLALLVLLVLWASLIVAAVFVVHLLGY